MNKKIFILLSIISFSISSITHTISRKDLLLYSGNCLAKSAIFYAATIWFAKETVRDIGYRYVHCKENFNEERKELELYAQESNSKLSDQELNFFAFTQALSAAPREYWREIASTAITGFLFYLGTKNLKRGLRYL